MEIKYSRLIRQKRYSLFVNVFIYFVFLIGCIYASIAFDSNIRYMTAIFAVVIAAFGIYCVINREKMVSRRNKRAQNEGFSAVQEFSIKPYEKNTFFEYVMDLCGLITYISINPNRYIFGTKVEFLFGSMYFEQIKKQIKNEFGIDTDFSIDIKKPELKLNSVTMTFKEYEIIFYIGKISLQKNKEEIPPQMIREELDMAVQKK